MLEGRISNVLLLQFTARLCQGGGGDGVLIILYWSK